MRNHLALLFVIASLTACGGGGSGSGNPSGLEIPIGTISGVTFDGLILNADVKIFDFSTGTKGELLAESVSNSAGRYSISLKVESRPILIEISGGSYFEEAGAGYQIALNSNKLSALTNYTSGETISTAVTTYTHMAAGLAAYQISKGSSVVTAINESNGRVSALTGFNILTTMPAQITDQINAYATLTPELCYGFLAGAISSWTYNHAPAAHAHIAPYTSIDFAQLAYRDISADGILDGKGLDGTGSLVQLSFGSTPLNADVYRHGIGAGVLQMAANANNKSSLAVADVLPLATSYIANTDAMFNGVAPAAFVAPTVTTAAPVAGSVVNGLLNVAATTSSTVGLTKVELLVDTVPKTTATNLAAPTFQIDTAAYGDGVHTIGVVATDLTGKVTTSQVSITVNNTAPAVTIAAPVANSAATGLLTVSGSTNSIAGLSRVELLVNNVSIANAASLSAPSFSFDTKAYPDGVYTIGLRATSTGGLVSITSVQVTFLNNPPVVTITAPATNSWARKTITVTGTVTSPNALTKVELLVDGASVANAASLAAPSFLWDTTAAAYPDGPHSVALRATDSLGLITTSSPVTVKMDNTPPTTIGDDIIWRVAGTILGCPLDNYSGVFSAVNITTGAAATISTEANPPLTSPTSACGEGNQYFRLTVDTGNLVRLRDSAGNCSDYSVTSSYSDWFGTVKGLALSVSGSCP